MSDELPEVVIEGVEIAPLQFHNDSRGWLAEIYEDELGVRPVMAYVSLTRSGVARGPHEHRDQADVFLFMGPSTFRVYLWDKRAASPTSGRRMVFEAGESFPARVVVPAGVVHAYKNIGAVGGLVINLPDRLYDGRRLRRKSSSSWPRSTRPCSTRFLIKHRFLFSWTGVEVLRINPRTWKAEPETSITARGAIRPSLFLIKYRPNES